MDLWCEFCLQCMKIDKNIPLHVEKIRLWKRCLRARKSCWEEVLNLNLPPTPRLANKSPTTNFFFNCLLENNWIKSPLPCYVLLPCHEGVKQNTIGVIIRTNVKVSHHNYLVENETPLVRHISLWCHMIKQMNDGKDEVRWDMMN